MILTHNFDFYRTAFGRLNIIRKNCYIVHKEYPNILQMTEFKYRRDYLKNSILIPIKDGKINTPENECKLIASIPYFRNLCEYMGLDAEWEYLTEILHIKSNTRNITIDQYWSTIMPKFQLSPLQITNPNESILSKIEAVADTIYTNPTNDVVLENKIVLSIAIRLKAEIILEKILIKHNINTTCSENQTRVWYTKALPHLSTDEKKIMNKVMIMTPESIHFNSFMYEPIIDMSDWMLKELYQEIKML